MAERKVEYQAMHIRIDYDSKRTRSMPITDMSIP